MDESDTGASTDETPDTGYTSAAPVPVIEFLSGRFRGTHERLAEQTVFLIINEFGGISIVPASRAEAETDYPLRLHRSGDTYELEVDPVIQVWVNGNRVSLHTLTSGELLEIGRNGPMLRFRIYPAGEIPRRSSASAFVDCIDSARYSDGSLARRTCRLVSGITSELVIHTTVWFRILVIGILITLVISTVYLSRQSRQLEQRLAEESGQMREIAELLQQNERNAITRDELIDLRSQLVERVSILEARSVAVREIIAEASKSIVFLQGSYSYFDRESELPLRYVGLDSEGQPLATPVGPALTLEGDGPIVDFEYTGTAFLAGARELLVTSRHVALPWEINPVNDQFEEMGLAPRLDRFIGYLPGVTKPFVVELLNSSEEVDVAILRGHIPVQEDRRLAISTTPANPGDEVIVMGYPTGIRAMLARTNTGFLDSISTEGSLHFWEVVERLSASGLITPIATRGIVGQVSADAVVYDASTTRGGSGGPVLNLQGEVVAINTAFLREFGGSNIGLPVVLIEPVLSRSLELLESGRAQ